MNLFGCAMTSPATVLAWVEEQQLPGWVLPMGKVVSQEVELLKPLTAASVVLILTYADFKANLPFFNLKKFKKKIFILFAPVVRFLSIQPVVVLDVVALDVALQQPYQFKPVALDQLLTQYSRSVVTIAPDKYLPRLIQNALAGSILTALMTNLYRIPNGKIQNDYRDKLIGWLVLGDGELTTLQEILAPITPGELRETLYALVAEALPYRTVFQVIQQAHAEGKKVSYTKLAKLHQVNEFDLRYMHSIARKLNFSARD